MLKNLDSVKNILKSICIKTKQVNFEELTKMSRFWLNKYGSFALDRNEVSNVYKIANYIREVFNNGQYFNDVSKTDIEGLLQEFISETISLKTQKDKINQIEDFENYISIGLNDKIDDYEIFFPLLNFKFVKGFNFGNLKFYKFSNYQLKKELKYLRDILLRNNHMTEKDKLDWLNIFENELSKYLNMVMIKFNFKSTFTAVKLKSYNLTLLHTNVIKFLYYDISKNKPTVKKVNLDYNPYESFVKTKESFATSTYLLIDVALELNDMTFLKSNEAKSLSHILKQENKNDIHNRILSGINWAVYAIENTPRINDENDFYNSSVFMTPTKTSLSLCLLNVMIAFETLLIFSDERTIKRELLKYRCITLLENSNFNKDDISNIISESYKIRSEIIHEGKFLTTPGFVFKLYIIFRSCVSKLISLTNRRRITTDYQLSKYFLMKSNFIKHEEEKILYNNSLNNT